MLELIKSIIKSGLGTISSIFFGVLTSKLIALELGPTGLGLFSITKQAIVALSSLGTGTQVALVQYVAAKDGNKLRDSILVVFYMFAIFSILISATAGIFSYYYSDKLSKITQLSATAFFFISVAAVIFNIYYFVRASLNGLRKIGTIASLDSISAILTLIITIPAIHYINNGRVESFAVALICSQLTTLLIAGFLLNKCIRTLSLNNKKSPTFDLSTSYAFFKLAAPTLIAALVASGSILAVKTTVNEVMSIQHVGYFDAAWTISVSYVTLLLAACGTYFLPTLVVKIKQENHSRLIDDMCRVCLAIAVPMIITLIVTKSLVINMLYSNEFGPTTALLQVMLIGDFFKIGAWIFTIPALALRDFKTYLKTEALFFLGLLVISAILMNIYSSLVVIGFTTVGLYVALFVFYYKYTKVKLNYIASVDMKIKWFIGLILIAIISMLFWDREFFDLTSSIAALSCGFIFSATMLRRSEWIALRKLILD